MKRLPPVALLCIPLPNATARHVRSVLLWLCTTTVSTLAMARVDDAFGLAVFTVIGTEVALQHNMPHSTALIMGVMTGVAGGVMRDVICNEIPLIFQKEIYATACLLGSLVFIGMRELGTPHWLDTGVAMLCVLLARLAAIRWHLALPRFHLLNRD